MCNEFQSNPHIDYVCDLDHNPIHSIEPNEFKLSSRFERRNQTYDLMCSNEINAIESRGPSALRTLIEPTWINRLFELIHRSISINEVLRLELLDIVYNENTMVIAHLRCEIGKL